MKHLYDETELTNEINKIYNELVIQFFKNDYPCRSYEKTFIRIKPHIEKMSNKISYIENKPQPEQRTSEWYYFRQNLITASNAWKALKSQATINQLIVEKCKQIDISKYDSINTATPMHHGNKYEELSIMFYENKYKTKIKDYGCIKHDKYDFIGLHQMV